MNLIEAAKMALDALESWQRTCLDCGRPSEELGRATQPLQILRAALAQPEQEPVAWWHDMGDVVDLNVSGRGTPLYFSPPQREWQGLTNEEQGEVAWSCGAMSADWLDFARAIEAKLKEKNGAT